jgi:methylmalonyl-CoA epimerase
VSVVVVVPGTGDEVQALKAGIMEIADIFVVNKADRDGADRTAASIEAMLSLQTYPHGAWRPPILKTEATAGKGIAELVETIGKFRTHTADALRSRRRARAEFRMRELIGTRFLQHVERRVLRAGEFDELLDRIAGRQLDPYSAVQGIVDRTVGASRVDHIGIAVSDLNAALAFYRDGLGFEVESPEEVSSQRVRAHFIPAGGSALELLEATSPDSPIAKFIEKRGPGLHHVTLRVDDIDAALERLKALGIRLIDDRPRPGAHGSLVAFIHPASAHGVLVELKQAAGDADR